MSQLGQTEGPSAVPEGGTASRGACYRGQVTYTYAYDIAYDMSRQPVATLLGCQAVQFPPIITPRAPRDLFFYRPQMVNLPSVQRVGPGGPVSVRRSVKVYPVGAITISIHVPFVADRLEELNAYHDLRWQDGSLAEEVEALANQVVDELRPGLIRPVARVRSEEAYTVFCLDVNGLSGGEGGFSAQGWLLANQHEVSGLLNQDDPSELSEAESADTISHFLTYHRHDLAVMDWDAALIIEQDTDLEQALHVIELANVQLAEVEAYDRILDEALNRSYRDLVRRPQGPTGSILRNLRELRLDLSRLSDELSNVTKFFGDWHLARVYQRLFVLFHLGDWQRVIGEKLRTVGELYQLLRQDQTNRWMIVLETSIVLLFVVDVVVLLLGLSH